MVSINSSPLIFLDNKYSKWYVLIINNALKRILSGYVEKHHIWPLKCGGPDIKSNIVALTAREHFIVHELLTKFTEGDIKRSMHYAVSFFRTHNKNLQRKLTARQYEVTRKALSAARKGVSPSLACRLAVSKAKKGIPLSGEMRQKLSDATRIKKKFWALSPDNIVHTGDDLKEWCISTDISIHTVDTNGPKVISVGRNKGWVVSPTCMEIHDAVNLRKLICDEATANKSLSTTKVHERNNYRKRPRTLIVLINPDKKAVIFKSLTEASKIGKSTSLQNVKGQLPYVFKTGSWTGWTLVAYNTNIS
jgi:DNA-binding CsgD family transcriptional regulator